MATNASYIDLILRPTLDQQGLQREFAAIESRAKSVSITLDTDKAQASVGDLADTFDSVKVAAGKSLDSQTSALAALVLQGKEGSEEFERLQQDIIDTKEQADRLAEAQQRAKDLTGQSSSGGGGDDGSSKLLGVALKAEALSGVGEFLGGIAEKGNELNDTLRKVQASTGATASEMDTLKSSAERAFRAGVGESVSDAVAAMGAAKSQLGGVFDDAELEDFVVTAGGIAKVFDKELPEVIGKSRTFITNFGLSGQEAGDLVSYAMQQSGTAMDDTLDTLDEYSQLWKQTGLSAAESVGLITRAVQNGARDTDKVADTIKETQIRLKAGDVDNALKGISGPVSETIQGIVNAGKAGQLSVAEVLQQSSAAIETSFNAGEITEAMRSQLQVAISGTPAEDLGSDLYGRIFSTPIDTDLIAAQASLAGKTITEAVEPKGIGEKISKAFESVASDVASEVAPVADAVSTGLSGISQIAPGIGLAKDAIGGLTSAFPGMASGLTSAMSVMTGPVGIGLLAAGILAVGIPAVLSWLDPINQLNDAIDDSKESFQEYDDALKDQQAVNTLADSVTSLADRYDVLSQSTDPKDQQELIAVSQQLADQMPETVDGLRQIEMQNGKTSDSYVIQADKVRQLAEEERKAAADRSKEAKTDAVDSLGGLLDEIEDSTAAMADLKKERDEYQKAVDEGKGDQVIGLLDFESAKTNLKDARGEIKELSETQMKARDAARAHIADLQAQGYTLQQIADDTKKPVEQIRLLGDASLDSGNKTLQLFGPDKTAAADTYTKRVSGLTKVYQDQQTELARLEEQRKKEGASPELDRAIESQKKKIAETGKQLTIVLDSGRQAGLGTEKQIAQVAKAFRITEKEAADLVKRQKESTAAAADTKRSVDSIGKEFDDAASKAQSSFSTAKSAIAELILEGKEGTQEWKEAMASVRDTAQETARIADAQKRADRLAETQEEKEARLDAERQKREDAAERRASNERQREERRINGLERVAARERATIIDDRQRREREIADTERFGLLRLEAERTYLNATNFALKEGGNKNTQELANNKDAQRDLTATKNADLLALDKEFDKTETDRRRERSDEDLAIEQAATQRLVDQLKQRGDLTLKGVQELGAAEASLRKQQREAQLRQEVEGSREYQDAVADLWARVAAAADEKAFTPDTIATELSTIFNRVQDTLGKGTTAAAQSYQTLVQNLNETDLRAVEEQGFREEEAAARAIENRAERTFKLSEIAARRQREADLRAAGTDATARAQAVARYDAALSIAREEREIAAITDRAERARRIELLEARKTFAAALEASKGNLGQQEDAYFAYVKAKRDADERYATESSIFLASALSFQKELYTGFLHDISEERRQQLEGEQSDIDQQTAELIQSYQDQQIALEEYYNKARELAERQLAIENELGEARYGWAQVLADLNKGLEAGFKASGTIFNEQMDRAAQSAIDLTYLSDAELKELGISAEEASTKASDAMSHAWELAGAAAVSATLEAGAAGKNMLREGANAAIDTATKLLAAQIPVWIAGILGVEVSKLGLAGIVTAGIATGALYAAVAAAKSALASAHFEHGGFTGNQRNRHIIVNDGPGEDYEEWVANGRLVSKERVFFEHLERTKSIDLAFAAARPSSLSALAVTPEGTIQTIRAEIEARMAHRQQVLDLTDVWRIEEMVEEERRTRRAIENQTGVLAERIAAVEETLRITQAQNADLLRNIRSLALELPNHIARLAPPPQKPTDPATVYARR